MIFVSDGESKRRLWFRTVDVAEKGLTTEKLLKLELPREVVFVIELESNTLCDS